jgi:hypothetical protein
LVPREGFEPPTCGIEAHCSNPLSYRGEYQPLKAGNDIIPIYQI